MSVVYYIVQLKLRPLELRPRLHGDCVEAPNGVLAVTYVRQAGQILQLVVYEEAQVSIIQAVE